MLVINFLNGVVLWFHVKKLSELGERNAIRLISEILTKGNIAVGIGDDCAAIQLGKDYLLVTTDMISQKTHILKEMTPFQIGWFVVAINLSDIAAKGGKPLGLVLSFGLPKNTNDIFLNNLTEGADKCATKFDTAIIGGDMKETSEITLCGSAIGIVKKEEFMPRKGAQVGDIVAVTGTIGKAGAGYYNLKYKILKKDVSKALFEPVPRLKEGGALAKQKCVTSCMDISDGLSSSLYQLQELNGVGFEINRNNLPTSQELLQLSKEQQSLNIYDMALHFGGDYELLLTIPSKKFNKTKVSLKKIGATLTAIGTVIREKKVLIVDGKVKKILENKGYEHFKQHIFDLPF